MYKTIVVGYHKSDTARDAVAHAVALATELGSNLNLVTSYDEGEDADAARADAEAQLEARQLASGRPIETHVRPGTIADVIGEVAEEVRADLIVVGNKGLPGSKRVTNSVAGAVSANAPCDVLIAHTT